MASVDDTSTGNFPVEKPSHRVWVAAVMYLTVILEHQLKSYGKHMWEIFMCIVSSTMLNVNHHMDGLDHKREGTGFTN